MYNRGRLGGPSPHPHRKSQRYLSKFFFILIQNEESIKLVYLFRTSNGNLIVFIIEPTVKNLIAW